MAAHVKVDFSEFNDFMDKVRRAGKENEFQKELAVFMEGIADQFLIYVQDQMIKRKVVDTRLLLNSFQKSTDGNVYTISDNGMTIEVGTNVEYASYVNKGHHLNPTGVNTRFVPGYWKGDRFIYDPGANTGMILKQKFIEGSHYFDHAIEDIEKFIPTSMNARVEEWSKRYFGL